MVMIDEYVKSEKRFTSLVKELSDIIFILEKSGAIRFVSDSIENILGYEPEDLTGKNIGHLIHKKNRTQFKALFKNTIKENRGTFIKEFQFQHNNGMWIYLEISGTNLLSDSNVNGFVLNGRDITYRKEIESVLEKINRQKEMILEFTGDGIFGVNCNRKCTFINPVAARLLKIIGENVIGEPDHDVVTYLDENKKKYKKIKEPVANALKKGTVSRISNGFFQCTDGTTFPVEYIVNPIKENTKITGAVITFSDITERKLAEQQLELAKTEAERANNAKSEFIANMSHEIRTPLNSIIGFLDILQNTKLHPDQSEYVQIIRESSFNLLNIINDILDISKIEKGKLELDIIEFNPVKEFETTVNLFSTATSEKDITFITYIDPALPAAIQGDPLRINQALINLLGNAVKFTGTEGMITVEILLTEVRDKKCTVHFSVKDTGIGIPDEKQKIIFDAFTQADSSVTRNYGGTGLGLTITRNLIDQMKGQLQFTSIEGEGSYFYFDLTFDITDTSDNFNTNTVSLAYFDDPLSPEAEMFEWYCRKLNYQYTPISEIKDLNDSQADIIFINFNYLSGLTDTINPADTNTGFTVFLMNNYTESYLSEPDRAGTIYKPVTATKLVNSIREYLSGSALQPASKAARFQNKGEILAAEDNKNNQKLMVLMLNQLGYSVDIVSNGFEAIDAAKSKKYDAILMDINMPLCDGIEATKQIKNNENYDNTIPVIALTAKAIKGERENILSSGLDDYIPKPVTLQNLEFILNRNIKGNSIDEKATVNINSISREMGLSEEDVYELLQDFINTLDEYMEPLKKAIEDSDYRKISHTAHKLKGSSATYNFTALTDILTDMESKAEDENDTDYTSMYNELMIEINKIKNSIL
jgi:PAS domain S-box-containing protein